MALLRKVRVVIVPVVNADGFIVSRGHRRRRRVQSARTAARRLGDDALPLRGALGSSSGVDLNRNYGAYWGGAGSSTSPSSELYRGPAPYSEPEAEAVHGFSSQIQPTVFITNHTFTEQGTGCASRDSASTAVVSGRPRTSRR